MTSVSLALPEGWLARKGKVLRVSNSMLNTGLPLEEVLEVVMKVTVSMVVNQVFFLRLT